MVCGSRLVATRSGNGVLFGGSRGRSGRGRLLLAVITGLLLGALSACSGDSSAEAETAETSSPLAIESVTNAPAGEPASTAGSDCSYLSGVSNPYWTATTAEGDPEVDPSVPGPAREAFLALHGEAATIFWDIMRTESDFSESEGLLAEAGQRTIGLAADASGLGPMGDLYGLFLHDAGEALLRAAEAACRGDFDEGRRGLSDYFSQLIGADTNSYYVVGDLPPEVGDRPYGEDIGEIAFREEFPVSGDGPEHCITEGAPCQGWFRDEGGLVDHSETVVDEIKRLIQDQSLTIAVVVGADMGLRHPIPYSGEMVEAWDIGTDADDGILVLVMPHRGDQTLLRQGVEGARIAASVTEIAGLGRSYFHDDDYTRGLLAILDGIEEGLRD